MKKNFNENGNILDRIEKISNNEGIKITAFERNIGASKGVLSRAITNGTDIQYKWVQKIVENYPHYSTEWLITGQGPMLKPNIQKPPVYALAISSKDVDSQDKYNNNIEENQNIITKIHKPTKYMEKILELQEIPLYDVRAAASLKALFNEKHQNILGKISLPDTPKCDGALYITGDSMEPIIKSGDIICYKEIQDFNNVVYGQMYLVAMDIEGEEYLTVKYITRSEKGDDWICLKSHNPLHSPQDFELRYVNAIALVIISIKRHI